MKKVCYLLPLIVLTGCFQSFNGDDELNTVPITNNPNIIPNHEGMIPGMRETSPH